jgi:GNAT superfamily N-acetyltransferase
VQYSDGMSKFESAYIKTDFEAIRALEADASELERIEVLLDRFNVFETIGFITKETAHSRFLAFLLDPRQKHGLGSLLLKRMLREALASADKPPLVSLYEEHPSPSGALIQVRVHTVPFEHSNQSPHVS